MIKSYSISLESYRNASPEERVDMLLDNYGRVPAIIKTKSQITKDKFLSELENHRRRGSNGLDVRVKTSSLSDPTARDGITNIVLQKVLDCEEITIAFLEEYELTTNYLVDFQTIEIMKKDYSLLDSILSNLEETNLTIINLYIVEKKSFSEIGDTLKKSKDTVRRDYSSIRLELKSEILENIKLRSEELATNNGRKGGGQDDAG